MPARQHSNTRKKKEMVDTRYCQIECTIVLVYHVFRQCILSIVRIYYLCMRVLVNNANALISFVHIILIRVLCLLGSKAEVLLQKILQDTWLLKDVQHLSPMQQTSSVEGFHITILHFAPKHTAFQYMAMQCR